MQTRYSQRVTVECSVVLSGDRVVGEGRILNVSMPGCLLKSAVGLKTGDYVQLRLFLPDLKAPLHVPLAAVRWVDGSLYGLEFIRTSYEEQDRLEQFVKHRQNRNSSATWSEGIVIMGAMDG